jgi:hypothetical protein
VDETTKQFLKAQLTESLRATITQLRLLCPDAEGKAVLQKLVLDAYPEPTTEQTPWPIILDTLQGLRYAVGVKRVRDTVEFAMEDCSTVSWAINKISTIGADGASGAYLTVRRGTNANTRCGLISWLILTGLSDVAEWVKESTPAYDTVQAESRTIAILKGHRGSVHVIGYSFPDDETIVFDAVDGTQIKTSVRNLSVESTMSSPGLAFTIGKAPSTTQELEKILELRSTVFAKLRLCVAAELVSRLHK